MLPVLFSFEKKGGMEWETRNDSHSLEEIVRNQSVYRFFKRPERHLSAFANVSIDIETVFVLCQGYPPLGIQQRQLTVAVNEKKKLWCKSTHHPQTPSSLNLVTCFVYLS
jgi:hypothetical protein